MLALRLARGAHPLVLLRRLGVTAAAAGTGFLLLSTLGHAAGHPELTGDSLMRLLWCAAPLAATAQFAVSVARTDPAARLQRGMNSAGLGPVRLTLLAAVSTALSCVLGVLLALIVFLRLRGDLGGAPSGLIDGDLLGAGHPLPFVGALILLSIVPVTAAAATAVALRPRDEAPSPETEARPRTAPPLGLPWGMALTAAGLATEAYASPGSPDGLLPLPGRLIASPPGVVVGWALSASGLVLAGPGLVYLCGWLLCAGRPGALRLLSGRVLQEESRRIGRPLGVLCAVASGTYAAVNMYEAAPSPPFGPLTAIGAAVVLACAGASALTAAVESRAARAHTTAALRRLGASASVLYRAAALRGAVLLVVLGPLTWAIAGMAAVPLVQ
ncbi:hypothetical protein [Streptomyces halobius]|uniref:Integral membrane protein n=1 Tax=Streptomyces halobius TaxID=2879846 RepID=A0ABY4M968_9ACTN|nr:hypothetical protein [Streptomyces halobius]UQA92816.1 hypothetical protein K9S39_14110 [Streptomyces halobius]